MDSPQRSFIAQLARDATQFASVAPRLQRGLGNVVAGVVDQLSTSPLDFVYQLLQNADDKEYEHGVVPEMGFIIKPTKEGGYVHAWDNGLPLSNEQVEALVTFRSTKRDDHATIGEKGIGWHSVFRVSYAPHVYSGGFSFKLGGAGLESMLRPQWVEESDLPFQPQSGTNFFLPLRILDDATLRDLDSLRERFSPSTLLFLRRLRRVRIEPERFAVELEGDVWVVRAQSSKQKIEKVVQQVIVVRPPAALPPPDIQARDTQIVFAFPLVPSGTQSLFAWLPVMASGLKFLVHADFVTTLSREALLADSWNAWLWRQLPEALVAAVDQLVALHDGPLYSTWLNLWPTSDLHVPELQTSILEAEVVLRERPIVATSKGLRPPTSCVLAGQEERAILPDAELALIKRFYPLCDVTVALSRLGAETFGPDLLRIYVSEQASSLLRRYKGEARLLDRVVKYLMRHEASDVACLPVSTPAGPRLQSPGSQLIAKTGDEVRKLAEMGLPVVLSAVSSSSRAWLEGLGLRRATPEAVLETILSSEEIGSDISKSVLQLSYLYNVWDELSSASRTRLSGGLLVWSETVDGDAMRTPIRSAHIRDPGLMRLFNGSLAVGSVHPPTSPPASIRFLSIAYDDLEAGALEKLGAWATVRLEEAVVEVPSSHRSHVLIDQWVEIDKLPATASGYKFRYWDFPEDVCKFIDSEDAPTKTAFLEIVASHWDAYEPCRKLCMRHGWRSKRPCPHGNTSCEECISSKSQRWELPPFLQKLRAMQVPTTLGSERRHWRRLDTTILLPPRERARLGSLQLPLPVLAADIDNSTFLRACGVATEVSADILLRGLLQLRERKPSDELLRHVQAFYSLLEHVTSDEAFQLTADWPILACDPCPRELERRALEGSQHRGVKEQQEALHYELAQNLRWFALRDVRWEGPPRVVAGHFALLSQQRTSDARRVYTQFVADILRVPDVGAADLVDVLDQLANRCPLNSEDVEKVVQIYEELAHNSRSNCLDETLLARLRRRLLTHRHEFVSGLVFACDNPREFGLMQQPDIHFLHFPQAVATHSRFLAQLGIPLAKEELKETYVGQGGSLDRPTTDMLRSRLEWLARAAVHLLAKARTMPAADWARFGELARVEVVPEVVVRVELGPAQAQRRVPHAVDWSPSRCAVVLGKPHKAVRSARSQRVLAAGVADLLATVCGSTTTTELLRLVGLILLTPQQELDELAEDERLPPLPPVVHAALGQRQCSAPASLLAPLRDNQEDVGVKEVDMLGDKPGKEEEPKEEPVQQQCALSFNGQDKEPACNEDSKSHLAADTDRPAAPCSEVVVLEGILAPDVVEEEVSIGRGVVGFLHMEDGHEEHVDVSKDGEAQAAMEVARLRVEAALACGDARGAQAALDESPVLLHGELVKRVKRLCRHETIVRALREAVKVAPNKGVEVVRRVVKAAEKSKSHSPEITEALQEARRCIQEMDRQTRCDAALARLQACSGLDAGDASAAAEFEGALMEAWEAGVDQEHPDFLWASSQLAGARVRESCDTLEEALRVDACAVTAAAAMLEQRLSRSEEVPEEARMRGGALLARVAKEQAAVQNLTSALTRMDHAAVEQALAAARELPLAARWVEHADRWLQQRAELEQRRESALGVLQEAAVGCDMEALAAALRRARECCSEEELLPFEHRLRERSVAAEQARMTLLGAHNVELLHDALAALLPAGVLPDTEASHWSAILADWEAKVGQARADFELQASGCGVDVAALEHAFEAVVMAGAGPSTLEEMHHVVQGARELQEAFAAAERQHAAQVSWWQEQQISIWRRYVVEEKDVTKESLESAAAFARDAQDENLHTAARGLLAKFVTAEEFWQAAELNDSAAAWRVAAAACRSSQQLRKSQDAEMRARRAEDREEVERQLAQPATEEVLLPALQRAHELGVPEQNMAPALARLAHCTGQGQKGRMQSQAQRERAEAFAGASRSADKDSLIDTTRMPQCLLPGEYGVKLLGKWERVSAYGAEALADLGLLEDDAKLTWGNAELPLHVVTRPRGYSIVEGDMLGKELRRVERKLHDIDRLEEKILEKKKLSQEEWHKVAHKTLHLHEHRCLQAKLAASGAEPANFSEVWEAVSMVQKSSGVDPFHRHLLEGAPAEPGCGRQPLAAGGKSASVGLGAAADAGNAKRIGALGELYVFTWLQHLVEGFDFDNWTSSCRTCHPEAPPTPPDIDRWGCDFCFRDTAGLFCRDREVLLEVKSMRFPGDPNTVRAGDFCCRLSGHELAVMREAGESDTEYYVMLWVAIGDNLQCRVVAILRQPHNLIPMQLSLQPTEYMATLSTSYGPPGLALEADPQGAGPPGLSLAGGGLPGLAGAGPPGLVKPGPQGFAGFGPPGLAAPGSIGHT